MRTFAKVFSLMILASCWATAHAAVPTTVNYQGYLSDAGGSVIDGSVPVTFAIYTVDVGGVPLWTDSQNITVD